MPVNTVQLIDFLIKAKKNTYAGAGDNISLPSPFSASKMLVFEEDHLNYRDIYFGTRQFSGQEAVSLTEHVLWSMTYSGKSMPGGDLQEIYDFLRQALLLIPADAPFRGPKELFGNAGLHYRNSYSGDIGFFSGEESICREGVLLYKLHYTGGWVS